MTTPRGENGCNKFCLLHTYISRQIRVLNIECPCQLFKYFIFYHNEQGHMQKRPLLPRHSVGTAARRTCAVDVRWWRRWTKHSPLPTHGCCFQSSSHGLVQGLPFWLGKFTPQPAHCETRPSAEALVSAPRQILIIFLLPFIPLTVFLAPKCVAGACCLNQRCLNSKGYLIHILII